LLSPAFLFNQFCDLERGFLRPGNLDSQVDYVIEHYHPQLCCGNNCNVAIADINFEPDTSVIRK